ncbi:DNA-processing protein DprA [Brachybacterium hainanense]|uniref:DNA-processing protein DprA n=1 Tax=Brachybacterium hainanense TaxID=1541174 RepID=A0ABV6RGA7_9MICO
MSAEEDRLARITWSLVAEPSDAVALLARTALGAGAALELAREASAAEALQLLGGSIPGDPATDGGASDPRRRLEQALARWRSRLRHVDVPAQLARAERDGIRVLVPGDPQWPTALDDLEVAAPHCLWVLGDEDPCLPGTQGSVAVVGSRASSPYGEDVAGGMSAALASRGIAVISGGAYGIDAAAHRGALAAGAAPTLAVLAGGLDALYPRGNARLLETIRDRHALLSEAPPGTAPTRWRFLARNRLIAALAQVTVVVEASWRSGALSTARRADDLSRTVAAVPGPVTSAASAGCHRLIRERGAVLVTGGDDVLELLPGADPVAEAAGPQDELDLFSPADRRVLDAVPPRSATTCDRLAVIVDRTPEEIRAALGRLELFGAVRIAGEQVRRARG